MENKKIYLADLGILPNDGRDYVKKINDILSSTEENVTYIFEKGVYRFRTEGQGGRHVFDIISRRNITIDGNGSHFLFYGDEQPFTVESCDGIKITDIILDFDKPLASEGIIVGKDACYIDLQINEDLYPCHIKDYNLYFDIGDDEESPLAYGRHTVYSMQSLAVSPGFADSISVRSVEKAGNGIYRLFVSELLNENKAPFLGDTIALCHTPKNSQTFCFKDSKNIMLDRLMIHSGENGALLFSGCENITCQSVNIKPNKTLGRRVSCARRGIYIENCRGNVTVEKCSFFGLLNDAVNIHGVSACVNKADGNNLFCEILAENHVCNVASWAKTGDTVAFIDRRTSKTIGKSVVSEYERQDGNRFRVDICDIPDEIKDGTDTHNIAIENLSAHPACHIVRNFFGSGRARGLLILTRCQAEICENVFESAGAGILIAGDYNFWFESGASSDLTIKNNVFTELCCRSEYEYSRACIVISPEINRPLTGFCYHSNIQIEGNTFMSSDITMLDAFSVEGLRFTDNRVYYVDRTRKPNNIPNLCIARNCRNVVMEYNLVVGCNRLIGYITENCTDVLTDEQNIQNQ